MDAFSMHLEYLKVSNLNFRKLITLTLVFVGVSFSFFVLTIFAFKLFAIQKNATTRVFIQAITCTAALISYFFLRKKMIGEELPSFSFPAIKNLFLWLLLGMLFSVLPYFIGFDLYRIHWENFRRELIFAAFAFSFSAAIFEEILIRDLLFRFLLSRFHLWVAFFSQLLLFAGLHFFIYRATWINSLSLIVAGILFTLLWMLTKDFIAPMLAHFISNFSLMIFNGVFTGQVARAGLLLGDPSQSEILLRITFEAIAALYVLFVLYKHKILRPR